MNEQPENNNDDEMAKNKAVHNGVDPDTENRSNGINMC
jgi:hypothetical protein